MPARRERASLSLSTFSLCKCFNGTVESALWRALSRWREGGRPPARSSAHRALLVAPPCGPHPPALLDAQFKGVSVRGHVVCEWLPKAVSARLRMPVTCTRQVELLACRHFFVGLRTRNISPLSSLSPSAPLAFSHCSALPAFNVRRSHRLILLLLFVHRIKVF